MELTFIKITLCGTWCNDWPRARISLNNDIYFDDYVQGTKTISIDAHLPKNNKLIIQHYDKKFGQLGQWDTKSEGDTIISDRGIKLNTLTMNDVDIRRFIIEHCPLVTDDNETVYTDYYGFNGSVNLKFNAPVYDWIIDTIVKPKHSNVSQAIETSHSNLFNYSQDLVELANIETILKNNAHLFNKSPKI